MNFNDRLTQMTGNKSAQLVTRFEFKWDWCETERAKTANVHHILVCSGEWLL